MTPIADMIRKLMAAGLPMDQILIAVEAVEELFPRNSADSADSAEQRRREKDRERKRNRVGIPRNSAESAESPVRHIIEEEVVTKKEKVSKKDIIRAQRLSADWSLPPEWRSWSLSQGLTDSEIDDQASRFKDYWMAKAGKDGAKRDWLATWRNWCRNFLERHPRSNGGQQEGISVEEYHRRFSYGGDNGKADAGGRASADGSGDQGAGDESELFPPRSVLPPSD